MLSSTVFIFNATFTLFPFNLGILGIVFLMLLLFFYFFFLVGNIHFELRRSIPFNEWKWYLNFFFPFDCLWFVCVLGVGRLAKESMYVMNLESVFLIFCGSPLKKHKLCSYSFQICEYGVL